MFVEDFDDIIIRGRNYSILLITTVIVGQPYNFKKINLLKPLLAALIFVWDKLERVFYKNMLACHQEIPRLF